MTASTNPFELRCPECGEQGQFSVEITGVQVCKADGSWHVHPDTIDLPDDGHCICDECDHGSNTKDFRRAHWAEHRDAMFKPGQVVRSKHTKTLVRVTSVHNDGETFTGTTIATSPQFETRWHAWRMSSFEPAETKEIKHGC